MEQAYVMENIPEIGTLTETHSYYYHERPILFTASSSSGKIYLVSCDEPFISWIIGEVTDALLWQMEIRAITVRQTLRRSAKLFYVKHDCIAHGYRTSTKIPEDAYPLDQNLLVIPDLKEEKLYGSMFDNYTCNNLTVFKGINRLGKQVFYYTVKPSPAALPIIYIFESEEGMLKAICEYQGIDMEQLKKKMFFYCGEVFKTPNREPLDFEAVKGQLGHPAETPILDSLYSSPKE